MQMHTWQWHTWSALPYLRCRLLDEWSHGFFTQQFWPRSPETLVEVLSPAATVYRVKQIHSNIVLKTTNIQPAQALTAQNEDEASPFPQADGLVTQGAEQAIWVCSADCTPALIADVRTKQVAAVHAGWRGTAAKILPITVAHLQEQGSRLADLRVALGPAIAGEIYQVNLDVAAKVGATVIACQDTYSPEIIVEQLQQIPQSPILADSEPDRVRLDVRRVNALQLELAGILPEQIAIAPHCTYQQPDYFFSYRRDGLKNVQWSGIVSSALA
jgi:polyphenol oxidase